MGRPPKKKQDKLIPLNPPPALESFWQASSRDELIKVAESSNDERFQQLIPYLLSPKDLHLAKVCKKLNIGIIEFVELFHHYQVRIEGTMRMMRHLPEVMEDVAKDAKSKIEPCMRCDGIGIVPIEVELQGAADLAGLDPDRNPNIPEGYRLCPQCHGQKEVRVPGDKLSRDLVFETVGLTGKKPPAVVLQQNFGRSTSAEETALRTHRILEGN